MNFISLLLLAIGLAMDAFAVSIILGLSIKKNLVRKALIIGLYFGFFQGLMPLIGYFIGSQFADYVAQFDYILVFIILSFLGIRMIIGSFKDDSCMDRECTGITCTDRECPQQKESRLTPKEMIPMSLATSLDALAIGVSFAFLNVNIYSSVLAIGVITMAISMIGVKIGNIFGTKFKAKAEMIGGIILVLMGLSVVVEHFIQYYN